MTNPSFDATAPAHASAAPTRAAAVLVVLGAAVGLLGSFPALYFSTLSVFLKPIAQEFQWGRAQTAGATVLANLGIALGALIVGRMIDRYGARRVIPASAALMALGIAAMGVVPGHPALLAVLSLTIGFVGVGTTPLGYLTVLPRHFDRRLGLAFGLAMAGLGLGSVVMPMLAQQLIAAQGWRMAYAVLAALAVVMAAVAWLMLFSAGRGSTVAARAEAQRAPAEGLTARDALRDPRFWLLLVCVTAVSAAALGFSVHGVAIMTDRGIAPASAARIAGLAAIGVMVGRVFGGALMDLIAARWVACASFALGGAGLWIYAVDTTQVETLLTAAAFLASVAIGAEGDFIPMAVRRYFGLKAFGGIFGVLFFGYAVGGVLGPVALGVAFDRTGDYRSLLMIFALMCGGAGLLVLLLGRHRYGHAR